MPTSIFSWQDESFWMVTNLKSLGSGGSVVWLSESHLDSISLTLGNQKCESVEINFHSWHQLMIYFSDWLKDHMVLLSTAVLHKSLRELKLPLILPCCLREKILKDCILSLTDINRIKSGLDCCEKIVGYEKKQVQQKHFTVFFFFKLHIFYLAN